jgi:murein DD-endopeptidase MepM/ murein hydrolase activator NlpD
LVFSTVAYANPFDSFERELKDYIKSDKYQYHDGGEQSQINKLFSQDIGSTLNESRSGGSSNALLPRLPSKIDVKRVISKRVIEYRKPAVKNYRVQKKDTLSKVARKFKVSVSRLKSYNKLKRSVIFIGQSLRIPTNHQKKVSSGKVITTYKVFTKPVPDGRYTSSFGYRKDPFNSRARNFHSGVDISATVGTPVIAAADGEVVFTGRNGGYGNTIKIRHKGGYYTHYAHCSRTVVKKGQNVKMGTVIGSVGRTGTATGAHLHFEVLYRGRYINPKSALNKVHVVVTKTSSKKKSS